MPEVDGLEATLRSPANIWTRKIIAMTGAQGSEFSISPGSSARTELSKSPFDLKEMLNAGSGAGAEITLALAIRRLT